MLLIVPEDESNLRALAEKAGIRVIVVKTRWIPDIGSLPVLFGDDGEIYTEELIPHALAKATT